MYHGRVRGEMIYDKLVKALEESTIFKFHAFQRLLSEEWIIDIDFSLAGTLMFVFSPDKTLIDVEWINV